MKKLLTLFAALALTLTLQAKPAADSLAFRNLKKTDDQRIDLLLKQLTLDEKINLLSTNLGVPRLGIPNSNHFEGLHGLTLGGAGGWNKIRKPDGSTILDPKPTTVFPQAYGLGETWDVDILRRVGEITAEEARWYFQSPLSPQRSLVMRAPNADLARDPRWGRTEESFGEDAFLTGTLSTSIIKGLQGDDPRYWKTASLMKHFLANSNEDGRDSTSSDFDMRLFREYYSRPFYMGITRGGAQSFMDAYNKWNGTVMMVHPANDTIARQQWGVKGIICTDGSALGLLVNAHHAYPSQVEGSAATVKATVGQFLSPYRESIVEALQRGILTEAEIDKAIRGNLYTALKLGLLDGPDTKNPYLQIGQDVSAPKPWEDPAIRQYVREVTAKSVVLLKNDGILPLKTDKIKKIAVIGQWADSIDTDWYGGEPAYRITIRKGLEQALSSDKRNTNLWGKNIEILYASSNAMSQAERLAKEADVVLVCVGNHPYGTTRNWKVSPVPSDGREAVDRKSLQLPDEDLVRLMYKANKNTVLVLVSSFPYTINWSQEHLPAIVHLTHCSQEQGTGLADVLLGKVNPAGRLTQTWVRDITDLPDMLDYDIRHGRTYQYFQQPVLYPFGYGLSYTTFLYGDVQDVKQDKQSVTLTVPVKNTGSLDGDEVIQVYATYPESRVSRPNKQLCAFARINIKAGETSHVTLTINKEDLSYWDESRHAFVCESLPVKFLIGASSEDIRQTAVVNIK